MIDAKKLFKVLTKKINFFTGVPDSVLKNFLSLKSRKINNLIAANEGTAIAHAIGYYLSTKKIALVYMQNSGLGNALNPLISIAHKKVYEIPIFLMIGWRGSPNKKDEPQHRVMGDITLKLLKIAKIKYLVLDNDFSMRKVIDLYNYGKKNNSVVALIIKNGSLKKNNRAKDEKNIKKKRKLKRYFFIKELLGLLDKSYKVISTTGYTSRELYALRNEEKYKKFKDFYMVGGMGHASSVASIFSEFKKKTKVLCLDGDGSLIMHLGSMHTTGFLSNKNFKHIVFNNSSHESVGGQPTYSDRINFKYLAKALGYKNYYLINSEKNIKKNIIQFLKTKGPSLIIVNIQEGTLKDLIRPKNLKKVKLNFLK